MGNLPKLINSISGNILAYAFILAAVATITMTFLEIIKAIFKLRFIYRRDKVKGWVPDDASFKQLLV